VITGYELEASIGRGGFGEIVVARRQIDGRRVILKIARANKSSAREQLAREADALRAIGPALAPELIDQGALADGTPWLALERLNAPSLAERLAASGALTGAGLTGAMLAVVDALADLHALGWRHLDLKPGHVFYAGDTVRLVDFGLASPRGETWIAALPAGTAAYMSPEQFRGATADERSDVYAAGAILFELATGSPPFEGTLGEVRQAQLALRPPRPSERAPLIGTVEDVILRCLAKDPDARYADGRPLREALRAAITSTGRASTAAGRSIPTALPRRSVGVVRLHSEADLLTVARAIEAMGGRLAHASGRGLAAVFEPGARENAVRLALDGATSLLEAGVATGALVDVATIPVLATATGPRYILPPSKVEPPFGAHPAAIFLTPGAAAAVPEAAASSCGDRSGLLRLMPAAEGGASQPPLIGRAEVLAGLVEEAEAALAHGAPAIATTFGEAGMGKTRLGAALAARLRQLNPAPEVVETRARDGVLGQDETLRALLGWALSLNLDGPGPPDSGRLILERALPSATTRDGWAPLALALGWLAPDASALSPWRAAPGALRAAAVRGVGDALRARARERPLCILLDDAHLADAAALDALEYAALAEAAVPLFVCALARPPLAAARPALGERAARHVTVTLGPLATTDAAELCRRLLLPAENVPARAVERLVERAQGVPVLLVELVRGLRAHGLVRQRGREGAWYVATDELEHLPDLPLVDWLAQREMAGLPEALAAHARLVALLADEVARPEVAGIVTELDREGAVGAGALDPEVATRRLIEIRVLSERGERVAFRHPLLREAVARSAPEPEQRAVHRAAFRYYLLATSLPERERLPRLAFHAEACGLRAEAASLWLRIADSLRARHAYLEAETQYTRALSQLAGEDARGRFVALRGRGGVRYRLGRYEDAIADLGAAQDLAHALADRHGETECLLEQATALDWMNDYARSAERVAAAEALVQRGTSALVTTRLELARGRTLYRAARFPEAVAALEAAAALAMPLGDDGYETLVVAHLLLGALLPNLGRPEQAEEVLSRAQEIAAARGDVLHLGAVFNNRRNLWIARGDADGALQDLRAFLRIGRDLGMVGTEYVALFNLGELHYQLNELDPATSYVARAVEIERRHPEVAARPLARLLMARMFTYRGDAGAARSWVAEVREAERAAGARLSVSDLILTEMVELSVEPAGAERWADLCARSRAESLEQEPIEVQEARALAALRAGRPREAEDALREAIGLADRIPNVMRPRVEARLAVLGASTGHAG
jgi:tetratricopeptide (TPR) repeat protein